MHLTLTLTCEEMRNLERLLHLARRPAPWCDKERAPAPQPRRGERDAEAGLHL